MLKSKFSPTELIWAWIDERGVLFEAKKLGSLQDKFLSDIRIFFSNSYLNLGLLIKKSKLEIE